MKQFLSSDKGAISLIALILLVMFIAASTGKNLSGASDLTPLLPTPTADAQGIVPVNFTCVANPGTEYHSVFLREHPSWTGTTDSRFVTPRGAEIKFSGKVENKEGIWFVIDSQDGSRRYVNAAICSTTLDLGSIWIPR